MRMRASLHTNTQTHTHTHRERRRGRGEHKRTREWMALTGAEDVWEGWTAEESNTVVGAAVGSHSMLV